LAQHPDLSVAPHVYELEEDTLHVEIHPKSAPSWAETAYEFGEHPNMRYDKNSGIYGTDGQPRVSFSGLTWVRYITDFVDGAPRSLYTSGAIRRPMKPLRRSFRDFTGFFKKRMGWGLWKSSENIGKTPVHPSWGMFVLNANR
jgi:hypothetical protein